MSKFPFTKKTNIHEFDNLLTFKGYFIDLISDICEESNYEVEDVTSALEEKFSSVQEEARKNGAIKILYSANYINQLLANGLDLLEMGHSIDLVEKQFKAIFDGKLENLENTYESLLAIYNNSDEDLLKDLKELAIREGAPKLLYFSIKNNNLAGAASPDVKDTLAYIEREIGNPENIKEVHSILEMSFSKMVGVDHMLIDKLLARFVSDQININSEYFDEIMTWEKMHDSRFVMKILEESTIEGNFNTCQILLNNAFGDRGLDINDSKLYELLTNSPSIKIQALGVNFIKKIPSDSDIEKIQEKLEGLSESEICNVILTAASYGNQIALSLFLDSKPLHDMDVTTKKELIHDLIFEAVNLDDPDILQEIFKRDLLTLEELDELKTQELIDLVVKMELSDQEGEEYDAPKGLSNILAEIPVMMQEAIESSDIKLFDYCIHFLGVSNIDINIDIEGRNSLQVAILNGDNVFAEHILDNYLNRDKILDSLKTSLVDSKLDADILASKYIFMKNIQKSVVTNQSAREENVLHMISSDINENVVSKIFALNGAAVALNQKNNFYKTPIDCLIREYDKDSDNLVELFGGHLLDILFPNKEDMEINVEEQNVLNQLFFGYLSDSIEGLDRSYREIFKLPVLEKDAKDIKSWVSARIEQDNLEGLDIEFLKLFEFLSEKNEYQVDFAAKDNIGFDSYFDSSEDYEDQIASFSQLRKSSISSISSEKSTSSTVSERSSGIGSDDEVIESKNLPKMLSKSDINDSMFDLRGDFGKGDLDGSEVDLGGDVQFSVYEV